jgi:ABC-type polysaccharide/polyol phosphate transport system ATPase subunit
MTDTIITVENLSKSYLVGHLSAAQGRHKYMALRDVITRGAGDFVRKAADMLRGRQIVQGDEVEEFWALKDVSFEVKRGEVLGIIGRNGAGKSTLLKILSRITEPTKGRVLLRGRVASLLEVGTGFHPELTGRENIFLNGAILGMTQREIRSKFDEIVAFAEVTRFLDTPVKRYSSGMYVRLAFAVAAHLEPEILVIDEVLAVGDAEFQQKCLGKIKDVAKGGRTVLFVSHNLGAISTLATRGLVLKSGRVDVGGEVSAAISSYLSQEGKSAIYQRKHNSPGGAPHISRAELITSGPHAIQVFGDPMEVKFVISHERPLARGCLSFQIMNQFQHPVIHAWALYPQIKFGTKRGQTLLICKFPSVRLNVGQYTITAHLSEPPGGAKYERLDGICSFEVVRTQDTMIFGWDPASCAYHEAWEWRQRDPAGDDIVRPTEMITC